MHNAVTSKFALGLHSEIEFLGRFFSGVDQLLPTLPMQGGHRGDGRHAGGSRQTVDLEISVPTHAQGVRRQCLLSSKRRREHTQPSRRFETDHLSVVVYRV